MKTCTVCNIPKEETEFDQKKNGHLSGYCKECRRLKIQQHYNDNKKIYLDKNRKHRQLNQEKLKEYKETLSCTDCDLSFKGQSYLCDFHHLDPSQKDAEIRTLVSYRWNKIMTEINKCIPLCANCHRKRHWAV